MRAYQFYEQANRIACEIGDRLKQEESLSYMGQLAAHPKLGNLSKAEEFLRESLKIAREIHNIRGVRIELTRLINILIAQEKYEEAEQLLSESECARKSCQIASGKSDQRVHTGVHASLSQAARAFAVSTAPGIIHCAPEHLRRCVTICLQLLSTVPLPIK